MLQAQKGEVRGAGRQRVRATFSHGVALHFSKALPSPRPHVLSENLVRVEEAGRASQLADRPGRAGSAAITTISLATWHPIEHFTQRCANPLNPHSPRGKQLLLFPFYRRAAQSMRLVHLPKIT